VEILGGLAADTSEGTIRRVLSLLEDRPGGRVLDAPAGAGALCRWLAQRGCDVTALDISDADFAAKEVPFVAADLDQRLPFSDEAFDYVLCVDGIEHLESPYFTIREFARILRSGGGLIISTPNISALRSRARFLFTGFHNKGKTPLNEADPSPSHHINLMTFPELRYALHTCGLRLHTVAANRVKLAALPYCLLLPFVWLGTRVAFRREKDAAQRRPNREILRQLLSWPVWAGETLVLLARKP